MAKSNLDTTFIDQTEPTKRTEMLIDLSSVENCWAGLGWEKEEAAIDS